MSLHMAVSKLRDAMNASMIDREMEVESVLLGMLARKNVLFVGPVGCAKSMLCDNFGRGIAGTKKPFTAMLNKQSPIEELFGPLDILKLKQGVYERRGDGFLQDAEIAFIDEIWLANSPCNHSIMKVMNERTYNGQAVPLRILVAASNTWLPGEGESPVWATFDRFLIRREVKYVTRSHRHNLCFSKLTPMPQGVVTLAEMDQAHQEAMSLCFAPDTEKAYLEILETLAEEGIHCGDRRVMHAMDIAKAAAWLDGSPDVQIQHLESLIDVLWDDPREKQPERAAQIVSKIANPAGSEVAGLLAEAEQALKEVESTKPIEERYSGLQKAKEIVRKLSLINDNGKAKKAKDNLQERVARAAMAMIK